MKRLALCLVLLCMAVVGTGCPEGVTCPKGDCGTCADAGPCPDATPCQADGTCPCTEASCPDASPCSQGDCGSCGDFCVCPDAPPPPDALPVQTLVDDKYSDFIQGTLSESGAKLYVSALGNIQLTDRLDLDGDGYLDLVFSNYQGGKASLYYGSSVGYLSSSMVQLATKQCFQNSVADLNDDGYPDIVFTNNRDGAIYSVNSYIYFGASGGFSATSMKELPTVGAVDSSVADLDQDGYLDIAFSNQFDGTSYNINSYIYWGSSTGFSSSNRTELPTMGGNGTSVADVDGDKNLDLVFSNYHNNATNSINSYIYYGSSSGFSSSDKLELQTKGAAGNSVADLDGDGYLDLVFSNQVDGSSYNIYSYIYMRSPTGTGYINTSLPTNGAAGNSVADLNKDGYLDVVFSNQYDSSLTSYKINSVIYWGSSKGFYPTSKSELPTQGALGNLLLDVDADGYLDVVFSNQYDGTSYSINSYIYRGSKSGFASTSRVDLLTSGAYLSTTADPGSVAARKNEQSFISRALDSGLSSPIYRTLSWKATVPSDTSLKLQLRSASTSAGLLTATWQGPASGSAYYEATSYTSSLQINPVHNGGRYIQYRALFTSNYGSTPVLDKVEISHQ